LAGKRVESPLGACQASAHGGNGHATRPRQLLEVHALDGSQSEDDPFVNGQTVQKCVHGAGRVAYMRRRLWRWSIRCLGKSQPAPASAAADGFAAGKHGDARQPGRKRTLELKPISPLQGANENLLHKVVNLGLADAHHAYQHATNMIEVVLHQGHRRPGLMVAQATHKARIFFLLALAAGLMRNGKTHNLAHVN